MNFKRCFLIVIITVISSCVIGLSTGFKKQCRMTRSEADVCAKRVFVFNDRSLHFPTNLRETQIFCDRLSESVDCLHDYIPCVTGFKRTLLRMFVKYMKSEIQNNYCLPTMRRWMVNLFKCLDNRRVRTSALHNCFDKHTIRQIAIRDELNYNQQFPARCCAIQMLRQCISEFADEVCFHISSQGASQDFDQIIMRLISRLDAPCSEDFSTVESCSINLNDVLTKFYRIEKRKAVPQNESLLFIYLDMN